MLKVLGAVLVFAGALGIGSSIGKSCRLHCKELLALKELLILIGNEMRIRKLPLPQMCKRLANQCEEPYAGCLKEVSEQLLLYLEASPKRVWKGVLEKRRKDFLLSDEEYQIFLDAGALFERLGRGLQEEEIQIFTEQVQFRYTKAQEELQTRQRVSRYLSAAGGIFLILLLI